MKRTFFALLMLGLLCGCADTLNNLSESVKEKNIAAGSDTSGGNIELGLSSENLYVPNITLWFGHRRVWYVSLKKEADVKVIPAIIRAGNSELGIKAGADGIGVTSGDSK